MLNMKKDDTNCLFIDQYCVWIINKINIDDISRIDDDLFIDMNDAGSNEEKMSVIMSKHGSMYHLSLWRRLVLLT